METLRRVICMNKTPAGRFVRVSLEDGHQVRLTPVEVHCRDVRVGDTVSYSPVGSGIDVHLDLRPAHAIPY